jgi:hypothetical protein
MLTRRTGIIGLLAAMASAFMGGLSQSAAAAPSARAGFHGVGYTTLPLREDGSLHTDGDFLIPDNALIVGFAPAWRASDPITYDGIYYDGYNVEWTRLVGPETFEDFAAVRKFSNYMLDTEYVPLNDQGIRVYFASFAN